MKKLMTIIVAAHIHCTASAQGLSEKQIQDCVCEGLEQEVVTKAGTRIDCLSDTHAIEVEALQDWAEAIGQSLHYAQETRKSAKVLFFCEQGEANCLRHWLIFEGTKAHFDLPISAEIVPDHCLKS